MPPGSPWPNRAPPGDGRAGLSPARLASGRGQEGARRGVDLDEDVLRRIAPPSCAPRVASILRAPNPAVFGVVTAGRTAKAASPTNG